MSQDPQRLFESTDAAAELRADLERAREDDPAGYDVAAGLAAFEASLAAPPPGVEAVSAGAGSKAMTWIIVAVVGAATAGAVAWAITRGDPKPPTELGEAAAVDHHHAPADADPEAAPAADANADAGPAAHAEQTADPDPAAEPTADPDPTATADRHADASPPSDRRATASPKRSPKPAPTEPAPDLLAAEMRMTSAAQSALKVHPKRALQLARKGNAEFPKGLFKQERDAIIVLALFDLGRTSDAQTKAKAYLKRHPKGSFASRVRAKLADKKTEG